MSKAAAYHHGNLRDTLVREGLALLHEKGPDSISLREVARRAGVSQTAPYRHFSDKEALLAAIAACGFEELCERLRRAVTACDKADKALKMLAAEYIGFARGQPALFRLMYGAHIRDKFGEPALNDAGEGMYAVIMETTGDLLNQKRAAHVDLSAAAAAIWAMIHGAATLAVDDFLEGSHDGRATRLPVESLLDILFAGIG